MTSHLAMDESAQQAISVANGHDVYVDPCQRVVDGRQLRAARAIHAISMQEMADLASVHRNTVYALEGMTALPKKAHAATVIAQTAASLGVHCVMVGGKPAVTFLKA